MEIFLIFLAIIIVSGVLGIIDYNRKKEKALKEYDEELRKNEAIKRKNDLWKKRWNELINLRNKARSLEKDKEYQKAIDIYLEEINLGENYDNINYNNYSHSIGRVIILYGKSKQYEKLKAYLESQIKKYPNSREVEDWETRLEKVKVKLGN